MREAHARGLKVITELVINHTSDQHPWFQRARAAPPGSSHARLLRLVGHRPEIHRHADHLPRHREVQLDLRPGGRAVFLAPLLQPPARPELRQPARAVGSAECHALLAGYRDRRAAARRRALSARARGHQQREPARDARGPEADPRQAGPGLPGPPAAGRGQPVAGGHPAVFRRRRRMPHGLPLPADAAHVHGDRAGGPLPDHRHPAADAGHPGWLPMGHLPAQPRRTDAGDGDRPGARLSLVHLCRRQARAHQPRHPPPPGAAAGTRPPPHRADERPAAVDARHAGDLLRRRDRHGRQHLPAATAMACARRCNGRPTAMAASATPTPPRWCCRRCRIRSTASRRSTSRPRRATRIRC